MPRFDGTGPKGEGPFSGRGEGYCAVRLPDEPREPAVGYAGREGRPAAPGMPQRVPAAPPLALRRWGAAPGWRSALVWRWRGRGACWGRRGRGRMR
jgi:hypothetical protein